MKLASVHRAAHRLGAILLLLGKTGEGMAGSHCQKSSNEAKPNSIHILRVGLLRSLSISLSCYLLSCLRSQLIGHLVFLGSPLPTSGNTDHTGSPRCSPWTSESGSAIFLSSDITSAFSAKRTRSQLAFMVSMVLPAATVQSTPSLSSEVCVQPNVYSGSCVPPSCSPWLPGDILEHRQGVFRFIDWNVPC